MRIIDYQPGPLCQVSKSRGWLSAKHERILQTIVPAWVGPIDRSGAIDFGFKTKVLDRIPIVDPDFKTPLDAVMINRAADIIARNRHVELYLSGGIDSTAAFFALQEACIPRSQFTVVYSCNSMIEYPYLFDRFIDKLPASCKREVPPSVFPSIDFDALMVTGENGDQLMGSAFLTGYRHDYSIALSAHWHNHIHRLYARDQHNELIEFFEPLVARAPFTIHTIYDMLWWANFSYKWQHAGLRITRMAPDPVKTIENNLCNFYNTPDFQQWSMNLENHLRYKTGEQFASYKIGLKKFILAFTGDMDYFLTKEKIGSLPYMPGYLFLLEDGTRVPLGLEMDAYAAYDHLFRRAE